MNPINRTLFGMRSAISLVCAVTASLGMAANPKGEVHVESIGTGDSRDSALLDACRLAVAKVHGTRIMGRMSMKDSAGTVANSSGTKAGEDYKFNSDTKTFGVRDNTTMSFQGLLLRFEVRKEVKTTEGRWEVAIGADVLDHIPDRFSGRQALVLPSVNRIEKALSQGTLNGLEPGPIARELLKEITSAFANHPQFVILERGGGEDLVNEEMSRAVFGNTAVKEQAKLQSEKVADIVAEIQTEPLQVDVQNIRFESTPNLFKASIQLRGHVRLIDVATKGELCRVPFEAKTSKPFAAAGNAKAATNGASEEIRSSLANSLRLLKCELLSQLGVANVVVLPDGRLELVGGGDLSLLRSGDTITLWTTTNAASSKVGQTLIQIDGSTIAVANTSLRINNGSAYSFKVTPERTAPPEPVSEPVSAPKPSLKDRIGF
jgi:hypothetical protein